MEGGEMLSVKARIFQRGRGGGGGDEVRRFPISGEETKCLEKLKAKLRVAFNLDSQEFQLGWQGWWLLAVGWILAEFSRKRPFPDPDGDSVFISSSEELKEAVRVTRGSAASSLKLLLCVCDSPQMDTKEDKSQETQEGTTGLSSLKGLLCRCAGYLKECLPNSHTRRCQLHRSHAHWSNGERRGYEESFLSRRIDMGSLLVALVVCLLIVKWLDFD